MGQTYNEFTGGGWAGEASTDYASAGANVAGLAAWQAYQAQQEAAQNAIQAQTDALPGYSNSVDTTTAQGGLYPNFPTDPTPENIAAIGLAPVTDPASGAIIGYNPANQGTGYQSLQGYTNETPSGGGQLYSAPVAFQGGYIDFGANYNAQTNPNDYFYYSDYAQALEGGNNGVGLKGTNGTISYGSAPENQIQATSTVGTMLGGLESDPTINGIDYTQGAAYSNTAPQVPETPTYSAAPATGTQSYNAQGQPIPAAQASMTPAGFGTPGTFMFGDNGSAGSISGVFSDSNPNEATTFSVNEPGSLTANSSPNAGTFAGQSTSPATAPTDTTANYFTYPTSNAPTASDGGVNQALGGISGSNPLGFADTTATPVNPVTGYAQTSQTNPALQALAASRSLQ